MDGSKWCKVNTFGVIGLYRPLQLSLGGDLQLFLFADDCWVAGMALIRPFRGDTICPIVDKPSTVK